MEIPEFRSKVKPGMKLSADGRDFVIREVVKFRFDDGSYYIKCYLNDGYVFAYDLNANMYLLVKEIVTSFKDIKQPALDFNGKKFKFSYSAHAVAEEAWGENFFQKGDGEKFCDYTAEDGSYLSLGIKDKNQERMDLAGEIIAKDSVQLS